MTESCQESTSINIIKTPASPQEELPILSTHEGSDGRMTDSLSPLLDEDDVEDVVRIAIISKASTAGRRSPEFHLMSYRVSLWLLLTYSGERTTADARASSMATGLWEELI
ncbi:hypothetical protein Ancab_012608 [Ancistrocladus abbreviatus]